MRTTLVILALILFGAGMSFSQENGSSPYRTLMSMFESKAKDETISSYIASLSRKEFKRLLVDYRQENVPSPQVDVSGTMSTLSVPFYERGAGKNDGLSEWSQDVRDHSFPDEWRNVILGNPPFKIQSLTSEEVAKYTNVLRTIAFSKEEAPGLRREALLALQYGMSLHEYVDLLKRQTTSEDEDPAFRREALLQMSRIVYRGRRESQQSPEFKRVASDYESLLSDLGSRTNLPPLLDEGVKSLKRQKMPSATNGNGATPH